jgi:hypothetical protein
MGPYCADVLARLDKLRNDFRAVFPEMDNFEDVCRVAKELDCSGNAEEFGLKMAGIGVEYRKEWTKRMNFCKQCWYRDDPTRCFRWSTQDSSIRCELEPGIASGFFGERWSTPSVLADRLEEDVFAHNNIAAGSVYNVEKSVPFDLTEDMRKELLDGKKLVECIKSRGNLSAPGPDGLTFPILKLEREKTASVLLLFMKMLLKWGKCPDCWKVSKTFLLYNGEDPDDPSNWRPISLTNIIYRIIFGRFAKVIQAVGDKTGKLFSREQKGFIPGKAGRLEHCCTVNMMIDDAMSYNKELYVMSLDFKDAFGSVPHELLKYNLLKSGFSEDLVGVIVDSYSGASSNIVASKGVGSSISIRRSVKQGCPLSPTLFNLCLDPPIRRLDHFKGTLVINLVNV